MLKRRVLWSNSTLNSVCNVHVIDQGHIHILYERILCLQTIVGINEDSNQKTEHPKINMKVHNNKCRFSCS